MYTQIQTIVLLIESLKLCIKNLLIWCSIQKILKTYTKTFYSYIWNLLLAYIEHCTSKCKTLIQTLHSKKNFVITCFQSFYIGVHNFAVPKSYTLNQELYTKKIKIYSTRYKTLYMDIWKLYSKPCTENSKSFLLIYFQTFYTRVHIFIKIQKH